MQANGIVTASVSCKNESTAPDQIFFNCGHVLESLKNIFAEDSSDQKAKDGSVLLKCPFCLYWSDQKTLIFQHTVLSHLASQCTQESGTIQCPHTQELFWSENTFENHIQKLQKSQTKFFCRHCSFTSFVHCDLIEHTLKNHFENIGSIVPVGSKGSNLKHIGIFHDSENIRHGLGAALCDLLKNQPEETLKRCPFCSFTDSTDERRPLQHHILAQHLASERTPNGNIWCPHCDSEFVSEHCFRLHFGVSHCSDGHFPCLHCKFVAKTKTQLLGHLMSTHSTLMQPEFSLRNDFFGTASDADSDSSDDSNSNADSSSVHNDSSLKESNDGSEDHSSKKSNHQNNSQAEDIKCTVPGSQLNSFSHEFKLYGQQRLNLDALTSSLRVTLPSKNMRNHKKFVHCSVCDFSSDTTIKVLEHAATSHLSCEMLYDGTIQCSYCKETPSNEINLDNHILKYHETSNQFICRHCAFKCLTFGDLTNHMILDHVREWSEIWSFKIPELDRMGGFRETSVIRNAIRNGIGNENGHHEEVCPLCFYKPTLDRPSTIEQHIIRRHLAAVRSTDGYIHCRHCTGQFYSEVRFRTHMAMSHKNSGLQSCPHCTYSSISPEDFESHKGKAHLDRLLPEILLLNSTPQRSVQNIDSNVSTKTAPVSISSKCNRNTSVTKKSNKSSPLKGVATVEPTRERSKRVRKRASDHGFYTDYDFMDELLDSSSDYEDRKQSKRYKKAKSMDPIMSAVKKEIESNVNGDVADSVLSDPTDLLLDDTNRYSRTIVSFSLIAIFSRDTSFIAAENQSWKCPFCEYSIVNKLELVQHCIMSHLVSESSTSESISCPHCSTVFPGKEKRFSEHLLQVHDASSQYMCRHCSYTTSQAASFAHHATNKHFVDCNLLIPNVTTATVNNSKTVTFKDTKALPIKNGARRGRKSNAVKLAKEPYS